MELNTLLRGKKAKLFTPDAMPNPAFRNTFQTNEFRCVVKKILLFDTCEEIALKEGECIASFQVQFMNMTNTEIMIFVEDFMLQCDKKELEYPLLLKNDKISEQIILQPQSEYEGILSFIAYSGSKYMTFKYQEYHEEWEGKLYKLKYAIP